MRILACQFRVQVESLLVKIHGPDEIIFISDFIGQDDSLVGIPELHPCRKPVRVRGC